MQNSIVNLIAEIEKRPSMFLGKNYISCLRSFLDGWHYRNPEETIDDSFISSFQDYIEQKYKMQNTHSWDRIILFYSVDEQDALLSFFKLWHKFLNDKKE
jgi:hypothetical protein